jgi:hypothetical protein
MKEMRMFSLKPKKPIEKRPDTPAIPVRSAHVIATVKGVVTMDEIRLEIKKDAPPVELKAFR